MSSSLVGRIKTWTLLAIAAFVATTALDYFVGTNSEAMTYATEVVRASSLLPKQIGSVERVDLDKFWGFRQRSGFSARRVELDLNVVGSHGHIPLLMRLEKNSSGWRVVSSSVPL